MPGTLQGLDQFAVLKELGQLRWIKTIPQGLRLHRHPLHCKVVPPPIEHPSLSVHALKAGLAMGLHLANKTAASVLQAKA